MRRLTPEFIVGLFVLAALVCFSYVSVRVGSADVLSRAGYELTALFGNVGGLKKGASVVIAGVEIGRVRRITLEDYEANVLMAIAEGTKVQDDAIATVKTRGLLGETFVEIEPGGSDVILKPGERIRDTQPALDLYSLISKYVFSEKTGGK